MYARSLDMNFTDLGLVEIHDRNVLSVHFSMVDGISSQALRVEMSSGWSSNFIYDFLDLETDGSPV